MPADITVGLYFPWLDYKWGFPTGVPVKNPLPSDIPSLLYPWRMLVVESLKNRTWPLWNPFYFGGMPLLANFQSATFSWVNIFFFFLPLAKAWSWGIIIQPFLTVLFAFLFLRHLKLNKIASLLGGIVFAFSGFSLMWLEYNVHGHAAMWLPLLLLTVDRIIEERKTRWVLGGTLFLALSIFAGYPQIVFYSLTTVGFYALFRLFGVWCQGKSFKKLIPPLLLLLCFIVLGISLSAVQWLPGYEAMKLSVREIDPIASFSSGGFLPWQNLVTFLTPDFFGNPATYNFWGQPWYDNFALYVGILPLLLAFLAIFGRKGKESWFFTFLAVFALLIALPTPIAKIVEASGLYGVKAISARIIFLLDFSLAILAALGLDWLLTKKNFKRLWPIFFFFFLVFGGLWLVVITAGKFFPQSEWLIYLPVAKRNLILPTALFLASLALFAFLLIFKRWKTRMLFFSWGVIILVVFDLFRFGWKYLPFARADLVFPSTPVIEFLQKQEKPFRVEFGETIPQNMWLPYGLESAAGYDAMAPLRYSQFLGAVRTGQATTPYGRVAQVENYQSKLFDLLNIKYLLAVKYDEKGIRRPEGKVKPIFEEPKFKLVFEDQTVQVYENQDVLPRAFLVDDYLVKSNSQAIIDQLLQPDFDLKKTIVLEEEIPLSEEFGDKTTPTEKQMLYLQDNPQKKIIKTDSTGESLLFISDNFYPGWQAFVDGEKTKIYRADYTFQAIVVPQGEHQIDFIYQPQSFKIGIVLSLGSLVLLIMGAIGIYKFRKESW